MPRLPRLLPVLVLVVVAACSDGAGGDGAGTGTASEQGTERAGGDVALTVPEIVDEVSASVVAVMAGEGGGSGVIYDADGLIATNAHVVADADEVEVAFADGVRAQATVRAADPVTDLAVLDVDRSDLPAATFSEELPEIGALAVAVGNPLGLESSVTQGIISGLQRNLPAPAPAGQALTDLIQTDAAISPGNSGGALVDDRGEVVGMTVAFIPPQVGAVALGFAIPAATVVDVVDELIEDGTVSHAFLGVVPAPVTSELAERFQLDAEDGVLVVDLAGDGPAARAGVEQGDIIVDVDGEQVRSPGDLFQVLHDHEPGDELALRVLRDGEEREITVTLTERPPA